MTASFGTIKNSTIKALHTANAADVLQMKQTPFKAISAEEFAALIPKLNRMKEDNINILRDVMVAGASVAEMVEKSRKTKQTINALVKNAVSKYYASKIPQNWVRVQHIVPPELADKINELAADALNQYFSSL